MHKYLVILFVFLIMSCSSDSSTPIDETPSEETPTDDDQNDDNNDDEEFTEVQLLDIAQEETFKYFWDYAEDNSGAARERYIPSSPDRDKDIVTTGGTGFGLMNIIVAIERQFISRSEGVARLQKIIDFLESADRFHGAWPHWLDGESGHVIPFSTQDDGGDLVETAFLAQGLITVGEYLKNGSASESTLSQKAFTLVSEIEWDWYTNNENTLYWHWSPNYDFDINLELKGYNETLLTYILAAASQENSISKEVYTQGWASNGSIQASNTKYSIPLVVSHAGNQEYGGPLFWAHYSYLGLNPNGLADDYVNYGDAVINHSKINYTYCVENRYGYTGYSASQWGLTASYSRNDDGSLGYAAHSPANDKGIISPTAALSSYPYTPQESLAALQTFYSKRESLLGPAGFYDAYSPQYDWVAEAYLAIDQGPIPIMIENYRTGLLWRLFMQNENVQNGLDKLGFTYQIP